MAQIVRSGIAWEISRAVGSRSESLRMEELEDLLRSSMVACGSERVELLGFAEGGLRFGVRCWVDDDMYKEVDGRLLWLPCKVRFPTSCWRSYSMMGTVRAKLPPAEKPERAIRWGSRRSSSAWEARYMSASVPSSTPTLKGYSGARRYSTDTKTASVILMTVDAHLASSVAVPNVKPPPWKLTTTGYRWLSGVSR